MIRIEAVLEPYKYVKPLTQVHLHVIFEMAGCICNVT